MHGIVKLELAQTTSSPLAIDVSESTEKRIQRLICENQVVVFSRSSCCMCHVIKKLLSSIGVHPTVIVLEEDELFALSTAAEYDGGAPAAFIGGALVGGFDALVGLHLSGLLVPKLVEAGALPVSSDSSGLCRNPSYH